MKKILTILFILFIPITVKASDINTLGYKWTIPIGSSRIEQIFDSLYEFTEGNVIKLEKYTGKELKTYTGFYHYYYVYNNKVYLWFFVNTEPGFARLTVTVLDENFNAKTDSVLVASNDIEKIFTINNKVYFFTYGENYFSIDEDATITPMFMIDGYQILDDGGGSVYKIDGETHTKFRTRPASFVYKHNDDIVGYSTGSMNGVYQETIWINDYEMNVKDYFTLFEEDEPFEYPFLYDKDFNLYVRNTNTNTLYKFNDDYSLEEVTDVEIISDLIEDTEKIGIDNIASQYSLNNGFTSYYLNDYCKYNDGYIISLKLSKNEREENRLLLVNKNNEIIKDITVSTGSDSVPVSTYKDYIVTSFYKNNKEYLVLYNSNLEEIKAIDIPQNYYGNPRRIIPDEKGIFLIIENNSLESQVSNLGKTPLPTQLININQNHSPILLVKNINPICGENEICRYIPRDGLNKGGWLLFFADLFSVSIKTDGNGTVTTSLTQADSGELVEFEVIPKKGYVLSEVKVTDANGNKVTFTDYKFTMPSSDVTIEATFVPANPNTKDLINICIIVFIISAVAYVLSSTMKRNKKLI